MIGEILMQVQQTQKINHYGKFDYEGINTVRVTVYTNQAPPMHFGWKMFKFNSPQT